MTYSKQPTEEEIREAEEIVRQRTARRRRIHDAAVEQIKLEGEEQYRRVWARYFVHALALYEKENDERLGGRLKRLNDAWKAIRNYQLDTMRSGDEAKFGWMLDGEGFRRALPAGKEPMELLFDCIDAGYYPPPELLLTFWLTFTNYLSGEAGTLEDALFGAPGRGKPSYGHERRKKAAKQREYEDFRTFIVKAAADKRPFGTLRAAADAFTDNMPISGRSFETRLRRNGGEQWINAIKSLIKRVRKGGPKQETKNRSSL